MMMVIGLMELQGSKSCLFQEEGSGTEGTAGPGMAAAVKAGEVAIYFVVQQYDDNKGDDKNNTKRNKCRQTQRRGGEAVEDERDGVEVLRQGIIFLILLI